MLQILSGFPDNVVAVLASGEVTAEDFRAVLVPAAECKFETHERLNLFYRFGLDFTGMSPGAMWEDTKLDIGHWKGWGRIAIVTDVGWIRDGARLAVLLLHRPVRVFSSSEADAARDWVTRRDCRPVIWAGNRS